MRDPKEWAFTREEFEKYYGNCPNWMWKILKQNYKDLKKKAKKRKKNDKNFV